MRAVAGGVRRAAKVWLLASAVAIAGLALAQDARPVGASDAEIFFSFSNTNPVMESAVVLVVGGPPVAVYVWVKDVNDPTGASTFQVQFEYDGSYVYIPGLFAESVWLGSTGRSVACFPPPVIEENRGTLSCHTFSQPPPYGPSCANGHCSGLLARMFLQADPEAERGTSAITFTDGTFLWGTPPDPDDFWQAVIPVKLRPLQVVVAPCADFNGDGTVRSADILYVVNKYRTDDPDADLDGNGIVLSTDILIAVSQYRFDCPE